MSENNDIFKGGGTSIAEIKQKQMQQQQMQQMQQQQQMPPRPEFQSRQPDMPQNYPPPQQNFQQMHQQQQMPYYQQMHQQMHPQQMHPQQMQQHFQQKQNESFTDKMKNMYGDIWKESILVAVLFIILNNQFSYGIQNKFIPYSLRFGEPPFANVFVSSIIAGVLFFLITNFLIKK